MKTLPSSLLTSMKKEMNYRTTLRPDLSSKEGFNCICTRNNTKMGFFFISSWSKQSSAFLRVLQCTGGSAADMWTSDLLLDS